MADKSSEITFNQLKEGVKRSDCEYNLIIMQLTCYAPSYPVLASARCLAHWVFSSVSRYSEMVMFKGAIFYFY